MFSDILAEVREYGEGIVIVDQIPSKLIPDVVKNTNLKIIHRLVAEDDRAFVGNAVGLSEEQKEQLVRLRPGEAVIHNSDTYTPLLVQIHSANKDRLKSELQEAEQAFVTRSIQELRSAAGGDYRRWPVCHTCRVPCIYLSSKLEPDQNSQPGFLGFFASLLYSDSDDVLANWRALHAQVRSWLGDRYKPEYWEAHADGIVACHLAQQIRRAAAVYHSYYRFHARGGHRALVALERQVMALISSLVYERQMSVPKSQLDAIRETFRVDMAQAPASARPGCRLCQRQCQFGILVQLHPQMSKGRKPHLTELFASDVKEATERSHLRGNWTRTRYSVHTVTGLAARYTGRLVSVSKKELPHLAYCFVTNITINHRVLRAFHRAIQEDAV
jgi:hypothetical protein